MTVRWATLDALVHGFHYFALWFLLAVAALPFVGIETHGRTIKELDAAFVGRPGPVTAAAQ